MSRQQITVAHLCSAHLGRNLTLTNGEVTYTDTLVSVKHTADGVHIETEQHWDGVWAPDTVCTIATTMEGQA